MKEGCGSSNEMHVKRENNLKERHQIRKPLPLSKTERTQEPSQNAANPVAMCESSRPRS
jgi:hypothetical protein